jgi:hypothetical protein
MFIVVLNVGVSQQLLLHLDVGACAAKHGRRGVTERMPPDFPMPARTAAGFSCRPDATLGNLGQ